MIKIVGAILTALFLGFCIDQASNAGPAGKRTVCRRTKAAAESVGVPPLAGTCIAGHELVSHFQPPVSCRPAVAGLNELARLVIFVHFVNQTSIIGMMCQPPKFKIAEPASPAGLRRMAMIPASKPDAWLTMARLLNAIHHVEAGGRLWAVAVPPGTNGEHGPLQIRRDYFHDAWTGVIDPPIYRMVSAPDCAVDTVVRYWKRFCPKAYQRLHDQAGTIHDCEVLARVHNGGPLGHLHTSTEGYWQQVRAELDRRRRASTAAVPAPAGTMDGAQATMVGEQ
jgi:hypothetical protein